MNFHSLEHYELLQNVHRDRVISLKVCNLSIARKTNEIYELAIQDTHERLKINEKQFFFPPYPFKSLFTNLSSSSFQIIFQTFDLKAKHFHSNDHKTLLFMSTRVKMKNKIDTGFSTLERKNKTLVRLFLSSRFDRNHGSTSVQQHGSACSSFFSRDEGTRGGQNKAEANAALVCDTLATSFDFPATVQQERFCIALRQPSARALQPHRHNPYIPFALLRFLLFYCFSTLFVIVTCCYTLRLFAFTLAIFINFV